MNQKKTILLEGNINMRFVDTHKFKILICDGYVYTDIIYFALLWLTVASRVT